MKKNKQEETEKMRSERGILLVESGACLWRCDSEKERIEGINSAKTLGKCVPGRGTNKCKDLKVEISRLFKDEQEDHHGLGNGAREECWKAGKVGQGQSPCSQATEEEQNGMVCMMC